MMQGFKYDQGKQRYDLIPPLAESLVVDVLTFGALKYAPNNWRGVSDPQQRYTAAAMRHLAAYRKGEYIDAESGLPHLAHAVCCLMFLAELDHENPQNH